MDDVSVHSSDSDDDGRSFFEGRVWKYDTDEEYGSCDHGDCAEIESAEVVKPAGRSEALGNARRWGGRAS